MKLRNKKTGDIGELDFDSKEGEFIVVRYDLNTKETVKTYYKSLEDLCEDWEDCEEPKEYWYIDYCGCICNNEEDPVCPVFLLKEIDNYFETYEEAEKAVEKLKAWKRLRDNGFKFEGVGKRGECIKFYQGRSYETDKQCQQAMKDLDLLFGGEE